MEKAAVFCNNLAYEVTGDLAGEKISHLLLLILYLYLYTYICIKSSQTYFEKGQNINF